MNFETAEQPITSIDVVALKEIADENWRDLGMPHKLISKFRAEQLTNKDYNDRQLLELLQNADDAGSDYVKIILNSASRTLKVINSGTPFTLQGFRSLMIPNLSTKTKKQYIGNKGLGFRSILNWSEEVTVFSAGVKVNFSKLRVAAQFSELYTREEQLALLTEYEYREDAIPFPVFAVPEISSYGSDNDCTTIEINYLPEKLGDIRTQLAGLLPEVLLFLNHIQRIEITDDSENTLYNAEKENNRIKIGGHSWTIFDNRDESGNDPVLPEEFRDTVGGQRESEESYSLKIAVRDDLGDGINRLFSYFPTKISMNFPSVIHGTFELDSSRNRIISSPKNTFLVEQLLSLMFDVATKIESREDSKEWDKFRFLNYKDQKDVTLNELKFYDAIDAKIKTSSLFPCFDDNYRRYQELNILPTKFTALVEEFEQTEVFPDLLRLIPEDQFSYFSRLFPGYLAQKRYPPTVLKRRLEIASDILFKEITPGRYCHWIAGMKFLYTSKSQENLSLLYTDKNSIAGNDISLFSPSKTSEIDIPPHVKIDYINSDLFDSLIDIWKITESPPSRKVRDELENFTELQPFEPIPVLEKIISETKAKLSVAIDISVKRDLVKAMLKSLLGYYSKSGKAKNTQIRIVNIPVINVNGDIIYARDSFLSDEYPTGKLRKGLLGNLYNASQEVADMFTLGIESETDPENFLVDFLGVNRFVIVERMESQRFEQGYNNYVFSLKPRPDRFREARIHYSLIKNSSIIKEAMESGKLPAENFIAWLCLDNEIRSLAESYSETEYFYSTVGQNNNYWPNKLGDVPSFIRYQLREMGKWNNYLLETEGIDYLNDIDFNYRAACFSDNNISHSLIRETLKLAGANSEFSDLPSARIIAILRSMPERDPLGKFARKIYMMCTDTFRDKRVPLQDRSGLMLHATCNGKKAYYEFSSVFYAKNIGLPARITNEKPILNYPKRAGEQLVVGFFGVQTFDDLQYTSGNYTPNIAVTEIINLYLRTLRPFILLRRLSRLRKESDIREAVRTVKTLRVQICQELTYHVNGEIRKADSYDFVQDQNNDNTWLICYTGNLALEGLKKDSILSDVISEIYSISFDLANMSGDIRTIYRDDYADTRRRLILEFGEDAYAAAVSKLEVSDAEKSFWQTVYSLVGVNSLLPDIEDERDFRKLVADTLQIDRNLSAKIDFENLDHKGNSATLQKLFLLLRLSLKDFNELHSTAISFKEFHLDNALSTASRLKAGLTNAYWHKCSNGSHSDKTSFTSELLAMDEKLADHVSAAHSDELEVNYNASVIKSAFSLYGIVPSLHDHTANYEDCFKHNVHLLTCSIDQINKLPEKDRSLLYFAMDVAEVERIKAFMFIAIQPDGPFQPGADWEQNDDIRKEISELEKGNPVKPIKSIFSGVKGRAGGALGSHSSADDLVKKALGLKAEKEVLRALDGKIVEWVSGYSNHPTKSDRWGYDIKYKDTELDDWNYIEVKWFASGSFFFSGTELAAALQHPDNYYFYLVTDEVIKTVLFSNLLNEDCELDINNEYLSFEISQYKFYRR